MCKIKRIAVYGSRRQEPGATGLRELILGFVMDNIRVYIHEKLFDHLTRELGMSISGTERVFDCPEEIDAILSIGGDGTFLRTVAWSQNVIAPILGINTGHLGYLTAISLEQALAHPEVITELDFRHEHLSMLYAEADGIIGSPLALNEVVIAKEDSASMLTVSAYVNGELLADYKADGLIIATPTGSTAYNLSVGGPIVEPTAPVWVLSPIAAHSLTLRPIIVGDDSKLEIKVSGRGSRFRLVLDGRATSMPLTSPVTIRRAQHRVDVLQCRDRSFARIINDKLRFNG